MQVFTTALRPAIADHLRLVIATNGEVKGVPSEVEASILESVQREVEASRRLPSPLPRPDKQSEVLRVLLHQWVTDGGPMTADWVARVVGCNYRTVAATLEKLDSLVERLEDRRFQLKRFPSDAWARFIATSRKARATIDYVDQSGQPRSPESLLRRVASLARDDIAVGGVFGAKHYLPQLDLVGSPRLDLCVHTSAARTDLDFVDRLDAALVPARSRSDQPRVSVHFLRRAESLFRRGEARIQWADPIECLVDLCDAGLDAQANEFLAHLESYRGEIDG
ncbi:MAG: hypothetical protein GY937_04365 [bacterium]|nr:hypothetical protein [bacterium]